MNRFTLKFNDDKVEQQFQKSIAEIKNKSMESYAPLVCIITLLILIDSILMQSLALSLMSSIYLVLQLVAYYLIHKKGYASRLQPIAMSIILSMSVLLQVVAVIVDAIPHSDVDWLQDISILLSSNYVLSTDISWNFLFFSSNLGLRLYIRFSDQEFSILSIAFIICSLISFYNEYHRILNLRLEFEMKEENLFSHNIFNTFEEKSIIILTFDQVNLKFPLKFQNNCSIHYFQEFTSEFLKTMKICNSNLGKMIYKDIEAKEYSVQKLEGTYNKHYFNVTYQVSKSTELQIFIIITKKQQKKYQLIKPIFYKSLLMKVKSLDSKLFHSEILKNLMYNIMRGNEYLEAYQMKEIQPLQLVYLFQEKFNQVKVMCHVNHSIHNNLLMIEILLVLIKKNLKVNQCTITYSPRNQINIILKGQYLKLYISQTKKQLFELILLRIGTGSYILETSLISFQLLDFSDLAPYKQNEMNK